MRLIIPLIAALVVSAGAADAAVRVPLNQATRVSLRGQAADVIVGNPAIADVNVLDGRTVYLIGKQAGVTNLVVLDGAGRTIFNETVVVGSAGRGGSSDIVTIARGRSMQDVTCSPTCTSVSAAADEAAPGAARSAAPASAPVAAMSTPAPAELPPPPAGASSGGSALATPR